MSHHAPPPLRVIAAAVVASLLAVGCGGGGGSSGAAGGASPPQAGQSVAPTISGQPGASATVGQAYTFTPTASGASGTTLTFSATNLPAWLTIDATSGQLHGTPASSDVGADSGITVSVSDGTSSTSLTAFTITVSQIANGSAALTWTAPTANTDGSVLSNLAGYTILYGQTEASLDRSVTISNPSVTQYQIDNLQSGTWYFSVVSINSDGTQSNPTTVANVTI
jgi:hypothetical protein